MKEAVYDINKKKVGDVELQDEVFTSRTNLPLIYETVRMQLVNRRLGCAHTKTRGDVNGTTAKMYRQKGTGRARHGAATANLFVGGGKAFGPKKKDYSYRIPKKARKGGVRAALSLKKKDDNLLVVDKFDIPEIKTKSMVKVLEKLGIKSALIVIDGTNEKLEKSVRNIPNVKLVRSEGLNVYDIMRHDHLVFTSAALTKVQEVYKP